MRKIFILFILFIFFISCLKFQENDLDPNSPLSLLLLLARLNQTPQELEIRGTYRIGGQLPSSFSYIALQKIQDNSWETLNLLSDNTDSLNTESIQYLAGSQIDFDGSFRFYIQEPGFYRWIYYQYLTNPSPELQVQGSAVFRVDSIATNPPIVLRSEYIDPSHNFSWNSIETTRLRPKRLDFITDSYKSYIGNNNGNIFYISHCIQPINFQLSTTNITKNQNPCLHIKDSNNNWRTLILEDQELTTISDPSIGTDDSIEFQSSEIIPMDNNTVGFILKLTRNDFDSNSTVTYRSYKIDPSIPAIIQSENVNPRGGSSTGIDIDRLRPFPNGMVYIETGSDEPRFDSNLLFSGSDNQPISTVVNEFFESPVDLTSDNFSSHNGIVIRQSPVITTEIRMLNQDLSTTSLAFSADDSLPSPVIRASKHSVTVYDAPGVGPYKVIPKFISLSSVTGPIHFEPGFDIASDASPTFQGNLSSEAQTIYGLETYQGGNPENAMFSWDHTTGEFTSIPIPNIAEISELESGFNYDDNFSFGEFISLNDRNITMLRPLSTSDAGSRNYESKDFYVSNSSDGVNWSNWEKLPNWAE